MAKFRKKPVVIEAMQFDGSIECALMIESWSGGKVQRHTILGQFAGVVRIETLEGTMTANRWDWVIRGVKNEFYPCKPDIFEATYEPVQE